MPNQNNPQTIKNILKNKKQTTNPPAYRWQELALEIIEKLKVPKNKKSAIFKVCKDTPRYIVEACLNDTLELCQTGDCWRYFFKLLANFKQKKSP